jgi:hypothetical protein
VWRLTEPELRQHASAVWQTVLRGDMVALSRGGVHEVILTSTSLMPTQIIDWDDYLRDEGGRLDVYRRVADNDERIEAVRGSDVLYFVPIRVLAPVGADQPAIEEWLDEFTDDWIVGPTFVGVTIVENDHSRPVIELRL